MNGLLQTLQHSLLENKKAIPKRELWVPDLSALCFEMPLGVLRMGPWTQPGGKGQEGGIWPKPGGEPGGSAKGAAEGEGDPNREAMHPCRGQTRQLLRV